MNNINGVNHRDGTSQEEQFVKLCRDVGKDESLVQGPGGNISLKLSDREMLVKASGINLKDVEKNTGYVKVDFPAIANFYRGFSSMDAAICEEKAKEAHLNSRIDSQGSAASFRPSIETGFHAVLGNVVVHTHPALVCLIACLKDGQQLMRKIFPDRDFFWVKYQSPGYFLTKEINQIIVSQNLDISKPLVFFLENHGLIISTSTIEEGIYLQNHIIAMIDNFFQVNNIDIEAYQPDQLITTGGGFLTRNKKLMEVLNTSDMIKFTFPDIVVFGTEIFHEGRTEKYEFQDDSSLLYRLSRGKAEDMNAVLNLFLYLQENIPKIGEIKNLTDGETSYITNMSAEKYRKNLLGNQKVENGKMPTDVTLKNKIKIIIPMTGWGKRFVDAGYKEIKPLIDVDGKPFVEHVVNMFPGEDDFIFIVNPMHVRETNLLEILKQIKPDAKVIIEDEHKKLGPVYPTLLAEHLIDDEEPVIVSYCDFFVNWNYQDFKREMLETNCDGCVISYINFHPHLLGDDLYGSLLVNTINGKKFMTHYKEKHCWTENKMDCHQSAGSYYFKKGKYVKQYFKEVMEMEEPYNGEFYVSQPYPLMHRDGLKVSVYEVDHFCQWGTPKDFEEYKFWSKVFREKAKEPRTYDYWKKFFKQMDWHPYEGERGKK